MKYISNGNRLRMVVYLLLIAVISYSQINIPNGFWDEMIGELDFAPLKITEANFFFKADSKLNQSKVGESQSETFVVTNPISGSNYQSIKVGNRNFYVYTNPMENKLNIFSKSAVKDKVKVKIVNGSGAILKKMEFNSIDPQIQIDISNLEKGIYYLKLNCNDSINEVIEVGK